MDENVVSEQIEVVDDKTSKTSEEIKKKHDEDAKPGDQQQTLQVSKYSPPQTQGDPIFKEIFLEQPVLDEEVKKADETELPEDSTVIMAETPTEEEHQDEELSEEKELPKDEVEVEEEKVEEKKESDANGEEHELRRQYWVEKLELVRDIRKRVLGEEVEGDV